MLRWTPVKGFIDATHSCLRPPNCVLTSLLPGTCRARLKTRAARPFVAPEDVPRVSAKPVFSRGSVRRPLKLFPDCCFVLFSDRREWSHVEIKRVGEVESPRLTPQKKVRTARDIHALFPRVRWRVIVQLLESCESDSPAWRRKYGVCPPWEDSNSP